MGTLDDEMQLRLIRIVGTSSLFWSELTELTHKQLEAGTYDSLNLCSMACMYDSLAEILKLAVIKRGDVTKDQFKAIDDMMKEFIKQTSAELIDRLSIMDGR